MAAWNQKHRDPGMLEERRKRAVQMIVVDGTSKSEVARAVGVSLTSIKGWVQGIREGREGAGRPGVESGYHFTCHVCGVEYCYIHMRRHDGAHPRVPQVIA